jgi:hypothetical protein
MQTVLNAHSPDDATAFHVGDVTCNAKSNSAMQPKIG